MQRKVALVIMDGTGFDAAVSECGYLEGCVALGRARRWKMHTALPSLSGPLYETIHTGQWPQEHGVVSNEAMRASDQPNIFSMTRAAGLRTAAVAQEYFHKLYAGKPWDQLRSIEHHDENSDIQHGRFYSMEGYGAFNAVAPAEIDLCAQMTLMMERHDPHYILLHSCSIDTLGHTFGGDSREYRRQVWQVDNALSRAIPTWQALGYDIIVTADHGMTEDHWHGGTSKMATEVACYLFSDVDGPAPEEELHQTSLAASVLKLLGIERPEDAKMRPSFL